MRASRLLQILLLLQNRGRMTSVALAEELEVSPRTILRDVDAMTEAGLPIIVFQGNQGGIELGFNYRTRLTGLAADEAEALGVVLGQNEAALLALGMVQPGRRAVSKLIESLPDGVRDRVVMAQTQYRFVPDGAEPDPRLPALAEAVRDGRIVVIRAFATDRQIIHPVALICASDDWYVEDALTDMIQLGACGDINISAKRFRTV